MPTQPCYRTASITKIQAWKILSLLQDALWDFSAQVRSWGQQRVRGTWAGLADPGWVWGWCTHSSPGTGNCARVVGFASLPKNEIIWSLYLRIILIEIFPTNSGPSGFLFIGEGDWWYHFNPISYGNKSFLLLLVLLSLVWPRLPSRASE